MLLLQWLSQTANFSRGQEGTWYSSFFFFALGKTATVLLSWRRRTWVERKEWNVGWSDGGMDGKNTRYERLAILAEDFQTEQWSAAAQVQHSWSASDRDVALKYGNQCLITRVWSYAVNNKYKGQVVTVSHHPHCVISHMVILSAAARPKYRCSVGEWTCHQWSALIHSVFPWRWWCCRQVYQDDVIKSEIRFCC